MRRLLDTVSFRLANHLPLARLRVKPERPIVSFTFDDAPANSAFAGAEALEARGVRGTYYICGAFVGGQGDLDLPNLTAERARDLSQRGHELACHTDTHKDVRRTSRVELNRELDINAEKLRMISGAAPTNFAYPYGHIGINAKMMLARRFDTCRGIYPGLNVGQVDRAHLKSVPLYSDQISVAQATAWIDEAARRTAWLIFFTHDVSEAPTPYGVTPVLLNACIEHALAAGCSCLPVADALQALRAPQLTLAQPVATAAVSRI